PRRSSRAPCTVDTPFQKVAVAAFARPHEAQSLKQTLRLIVTFDVDAKRLSCRGRLGHQRFQNCCSNTGVSMLWKQRNVKYPHLRRDVCYVEPADRRAANENDQVFAFGVVLMIVTLLRAELNPQKSVALALVPVCEGELFDPWAWGNRTLETV